jgi:hypothetical protein
VFIDRSPVYFSYILDYLRSGGQNDAKLPADELERERIKVWMARSAVVKFGWLIIPPVQVIV